MSNGELRKTRKQSMTFDFPEPFGPTSKFKRPNWKVVSSAKDSNPSIHSSAREASVEYSLTSGASTSSAFTSRTSSSVKDPGPGVERATDLSNRFAGSNHPSEDNEGGSIVYSVSNALFRGFVLSATYPKSIANA